MARILFTVCGIGFGHSTRSVALIKELSKENEVLVASYGAAFDNLRAEFKNAEKMHWFELITSKEKVSKPHTLVYNLPRLPYVAVKNVMTALGRFRRFKPDIVISDFDVNGIYTAQLLRVKSIAISHMHLMRYMAPEMGLNERMQYYFTEKPILDFFNTADYMLIPALAKPRGKAGEGTHFFGPIVRQEILSKKSKEGNFNLVYGNKGMVNELLPIMKSLKNERFVVYWDGPSSPAGKGNIALKRLSQSGFMEDLGASSSVICHGGISLTSEALCLQKPCCVYTPKDFYERYYNGWLLKRMKVGEVHEKASLHNLSTFLHGKERYSKNLFRKNPKASNKDVLKRINKIIGEEVR